MNANEIARYVINIDAAADLATYDQTVDFDAAAVAQLVRCADVAHVAFTNVAPYIASAVNIERMRFAHADVLVAFDATPADIVAYCDTFDCELDSIVPVEIAHTFFA